jgi:hypothetical protein
MATIAFKIGPTDHGRPVTGEEFRSGDFEEGYKYEVIDGRLYVSYEPDPPEGLLEHWLMSKLDRYARTHPEVINFVYNKTRVSSHAGRD